MFINFFATKRNKKGASLFLPILLLLIGTMLLSGCGIDPGTTGIAPAVQFEVITTPVVSPTLDAGQYTDPTPTLFPATITPTSVPPTTIPPTATSAPPTAIPPTPTSKAYCDWLSFVKDITIPDGTIIQPGDSFVKIWRIKNRGTCTWTANYTLVFSSGNQMGQTSTVKLPGNVVPGETVDVSVALIAPTSAGSYRGYWMLRNPAGSTFGFGENANQAFYVDIRSTSHSSGSVSGAICYPSEEIPPMTLYLQNMSNNKLFQFDIARHQSSYNFQVDPGEYMAYAWAHGFTIAGGYTYSSTSDHRLKNFVIEPGASVSGIDICDWYGDQGTIPRPKDENFGKITGSLSYPSEAIPPLRIVATDIYTNAHYWVDTVTNQQSYEISGLAPGGTFTVVAYAKNGNLAGGYTKYAKCGLLPSCTEDHTLIALYVSPGETLQNINPADWYGTFISDPTP